MLNRAPQGCPVRDEHDELTPGQHARINQTVTRWEQEDPRDRGGAFDYEAPVPAGAGDYGLAANPRQETRASPAVQLHRLTVFDDCGAFAKKDSILKNLIAVGETSSWIGPPASGKSALLTEIAVHCAAQLDWRGHKAKRSCGVVIFALERADLFKRRFHVYRQRDGHVALPIAVADAVVDILHPSAPAQIARTIKDIEIRLGCEVGLLVIDTYAKSIAAGGGDEDKAKDQNRAAVNLRALHGLLHVHIALVGHTGKDESRGARGSNAHLGDVDLMVQISGDGPIKLATITKGNDTPERDLATYRLESYELGRDEDGDPITTSVLSRETEFDQAQTRSRKKVKLPDVPKAALGALREAIADGPATAPTDEHVPAGVNGVTMRQWRERLTQHSIINSEGNPSEQFKRIHVRLKNEGLIGIWEDFVWFIT